MSSPVNPILVPPANQIDFDPEIARKAGYTNKELEFTKDALSHGYSLKDVDAHLRSQRIPTTQSTEEPISDKVVNFLRYVLPPLTAGALGTAAGFGTASTGIGAPASPAVGAAAALGGYTATDLALQNLLSKKPELIDALRSTATQGVTNEVGGQVIQKVAPPVFAGLGKVKDAISKVFPSTARYQAQGQNAMSEILGRPAESPFSLAEGIQSQAESALNYATPSQQAALFSKSGLKELVANSAKNDNSPIPLLDTILGDVKQIRRYIAAGKIPIGNGKSILSSNMKEDLGGYKLSQMLRAGPKAALKELEDPNKEEIFKEIYSSSQLRSNLKQLFRAGETAEAYEASKGFVSKFVPRISYAHGVISVAASLATGHVTPYHGAMMGLAGLQLSGQAINKVMKTSGLDRAFIDMVEGIPAKMSDRTFSRLLMGALQGTGISVGLTDNKGNVEHVKIEQDENGSAKFVPSGNGQQSAPRPDYPDVPNPYQ